MDRHVKYMFGNEDGICDDNDIYDVLHLSCIIDTIFNGKEFSFSGYSIYCMMNSFSDNVLTSTDMQDQSRNIVDTSVITK